MSVTNDDDTSHTVDVVVEFGEETLLDEQFVVATGGEQTAVFANPDESVDPAVSATVHDGCRRRARSPPAAARGSRA